MANPPKLLKPSTNLPSSSTFTTSSTLPRLHFSRHKLHFKITCESQQTSSSSPSSPTERIQNFTLVSIFRALPDWVDTINERRMKKKRTLYTHEKWVRHRSSLRHVRHVMSSLNSGVIVSLLPAVIAFTSFSVIIASYNSAVALNWLPPEIFPVLKASSLPYQLTAPALALLLVFRTEASYSRFEQGRKAWSSVISGANDLAAQVISSVGNSGDVFLRNALLQYIMAFPVALKCHIINESDVAQDLQDILEADDLAVVLTSKHRPRCIIGFISQCLHSLNLEETKRDLLESKVSCFHEGIGACEQLMGIPVPLAYTRLTSRFLVLWHLTLPVILWEDCKWIVVPATFISAASLFCIEEVGVLIEEPFSMLALDELCKLVQSNIQEAMANEKTIKALVESKRKSHHHDIQTQNGWPNS